MARGPRQQILERLDSALAAVVKVQGYLVANGEMYEADGHGEITEQYKVVYAFAQELINLLEGLRQTY